jgi:hypothetical protein
MNEVSRVERNDIGLSQNLLKRWIPSSIVDGRQQLSSWWAYENIINPQH